MTSEELTLNTLKHHIDDDNIECVDTDDLTSELLCGLDYDRFRELVMWMMGDQLWPDSFIDVMDKKVYEKMEGKLIQYAVNMVDGDHIDFFKKTYHLANDKDEVIKCYAITQDEDIHYRNVDEETLEKYRNELLD